MSKSNITRQPKYLRLNIEDAKQLLECLSKQYISHETYPRVHAFIAYANALSLAVDVGVAAINSSSPGLYFAALERYRPQPTKDRALSPRNGSLALFTVRRDGTLDYTTRGVKCDRISSTTGTATSSSSTTTTSKSRGRTRSNGR